MRIRRLFFLAAGFFVAATGAASAQDGGKAGVTIGYPASIGLIWHATDSVAIRPAFAFSHSDSEISTATSENESTNFGLDLGVLFYVKKYDHVRTYVSPRFLYSRSTSRSTASSTQAVLPEIKTTGTSTGAAGVFGAQYSPSGRFSVYGEVGIAFTHRNSETENSAAGVFKTNTWGTTSGVGVIFYF
jgi:Outer membrane protein beta-barrel domain